MMKLFFKQKAFVSEYEVPDFIDWAIIQMKQKNLYYQ